MDAKDRNFVTPTKLDYQLEGNAIVRRHRKGGLKPSKRTWSGARIAGAGQDLAFFLGALGVSVFRRQVRDQGLELTVMGRCQL